MLELDLKKIYFFCIFLTLVVQYKNDRRRSGKVLMTYVTYRFISQVFDDTRQERCGPLLDSVVLHVEEVEPGRVEGRGGAVLLGLHLPGRDRRMIRETAGQTWKEIIYTRL